MQQNIYTYFEYHKLIDKRKNYKLRFIACWIIQFIGLLLFIFGFVNRHVFLGNDLLYFIFIIVTIELTGIVIITGVQVQNLNLYELILAFFIPFLFFDKIIKIDNEPLLIIGTIIFSIILVSFVLIARVIIPINKIKKATLEYNENFKAKYGPIKYEDMDFRDFQPLELYLETGRHVLIMPLVNNHYCITVQGSLFYKKIKTKEVIIDYMEIEGTYEEAINKAIELLEKNNQLLIFKD